MPRTEPQRTMHCLWFRYLVTAIVMDWNESASHSRANEPHRVRRHRMTPPLAGVLLFVALKAPPLLILPWQSLLLLPTWSYWGRIREFLTVSEFGSVSHNFRAASLAGGGKKEVESLTLIGQHAWGKNQPACFFSLSSKLDFLSKNVALLLSVFFSQDFR